MKLRTSTLLATNSKNAHKHSYREDFRSLGVLEGFRGGNRCEIGEGVRGIYRARKQWTSGPRGRTSVYYSPAVKRLSSTSWYYSTVNPKGNVRSVYYS